MIILLSAVAGAIGGGIAGALSDPDKKKKKSQKKAVKKSSRPLFEITINPKPKVSSRPRYRTGDWGRKAEAHYLYNRIAASFWKDSLSNYRRLQEMTSIASDCGWETSDEILTLRAKARSKMDLYN